MTLNLSLQPTSQEIWESKYQLKDQHGVPVDLDINDTHERVARSLSMVEDDKEYWYEKFLWALQNGATPAGRIMSNAGAEVHKPATSLINCTVSQIVPDSLAGILESNTQAGLTLKAGCGVGYEFSTIRPKGAFVAGAGAYTSGPLTFMDIFDSMCFTVSSAGGRRGAQMATFAIWHPDVEAYIEAKREDGRLRQFNCSLLVDDEFFKAVEEDGDYPLVFPVRKKDEERGLATKPQVLKTRFWEKSYCDSMGYIVNENDEILCEVYKTVKARDLFNTIMRSTYDYAEPGLLMIDRINQYNNNWFCEEIRATNPCGEQPLPPEGSCLLGSINVALFVEDPFTDKAKFNFERYSEVIRVFTRMLDNVVDKSGLPLEGQREEILYKRRHGMGFLGIGSALSLLGDQYGSDNSVEFVEKVMKVMALEGFKEGVKLAKEKGAAPIFYDSTNGVSNKELWVSGQYMTKIWGECPELREEALEWGCRFTHHTSIAPTGTISLSLNNNASNGIEPSFSHHYVRNVIREGKKSKESVDVYSYEMLLYRHITGFDKVPDTFSTSESVSTYAHVDLQAAAQKWCDSAISKTINVPTDIRFDDFKDIYTYAHKSGLKGVTTFRFNPEAFQGVLITEENLKATKYRFETDSGESIEVAGDETIWYDGEEHTAANLYDSLKEGYYGKF